MLQLCRLKIAKLLYCYQSHAWPAEKQKILYQETTNFYLYSLETNSLVVSFFTRVELSVKDLAVILESFTIGNSFITLAFMELKSSLTGIILMFCSNDD